MTGIEHRTPEIFGTRKSRGIGLGQEDGQRYPCVSVSALCQGGGVWITCGQPAVASEMGQCDAGHIEGQNRRSEAGYSM
jgi:hypothetical protein